MSVEAEKTESSASACTMCFVSKFVICSRCTFSHLSAIETADLQCTVRSRTFCPQADIYIRKFSIRNPNLDLNPNRSPKLMWLEVFVTFEYRQPKGACLRECSGVKYPYPVQYTLLSILVRLLLLRGQSSAAYSGGFTLRGHWPGGGSLGPPSTVRGHGTERVSKFTIDVECILTGCCPFIVYLENNGHDMSSFHNFTGKEKENLNTVLSCRPKSHYCYSHHSLFML